MDRQTLDKVKLTIGPENFVGLTRSRTINHDGQAVEWIDLVYSDLAKGPDVTVMNRIVEILWDDLQGSDVVPVVSFVAAEEDQTLEAAE